MRRFALALAFSVLGVGFSVMTALADGGPCCYS